MTRPAITVDRISKRYRIGLPDIDTVTMRDVLMNALRSPLRRLRALGERCTDNDVFWALRDVSLEVQPGEVMGIIGRNGAGKSTLLKILSRITEPTSGEARLRGRVASLLEVGTGFHPELTGRENVFLNGAILGMRRSEIQRKFDAIVAFAEIERFLDTPVKRYSSGMYVRLAFAVAAHLEPEILIIDEVLAVGDVQFQKKCLGQMERAARGEGRTVLFVSHNMAAVRTLCQRCCLLENGRVVMIGGPDECVGRYLSASLDSDLQATVKFNPVEQPPIRIVSATLVCDGTCTPYMQMGGTFEVVIDFVADTATQHPRIGMVISTAEGERLINTNNRFQPSEDFDQPVRAGRITISLGKLPLVGGRYFVSLWLGDQVHDAHVVENGISFEVLERDLWGRGKVPPRRDSRMWWPTAFTFEKLDDAVRELHHDQSLSSCIT